MPQPQDGSGDGGETPEIALILTYTLGQNGGTLGRLRARAWPPGTRRKSLRLFETYPPP